MRRKMVLKPLRDMYLPADSLGLTAQIATPISLPGRIAGAIVFGQSLRTSAWSASPLDRRHD
jgi:hypothetical protein